MSDFVEQELVDHYASDLALALEDTYLALYTDVVNDAGTGTEATGGAYARQIINQDGATGVYWTDAGSSMNNQSEIAFPQATASWGKIISWAIMDAVTAGNQLFHGLLGDAPQVVTGLNTGDIFHGVAHGYALDDPIVFMTMEGEAALPAGVTEGLEVFARSISTDNFQISLTEGGAAVVLTADGPALVFTSQQKTVGINDIFKIAATDLAISFR